MSLKNQAAEIAQQNARTERAQYDKALEITRRAAEEFVTGFTGVPSTYVEDVEVAYLTDHYDAFNRRTKIVGHDTWMVVRVDDIDLIVRKQKDSYDPKKPKFDASIGFQDPQLGWYRPQYFTFSVYSYDRLEKAEERTAKFLQDYARRDGDSNEHPAITLRKEGETCPTCGRGF